MDLTEKKKIITFKVKSLAKLTVDLVGFDKINSKTGWIQKGINIVEKRFPSVIKYISKQSAISKIDKFKIVLECHKSTSEDRLRKIFIFWVEKELGKRIVFMIFEGMILPLTPIMALLPGPNIFFYIPALFFYYHWVSFWGLKRLDFKKLDLEVRYIDKGKKGGDRI